MVMIGLTCKAQPSTSQLAPNRIMTASSLKGDVSGDGIVNITDFTMTVLYLLEQPDASFILANADTNEDDNVTISDAVKIIDLILSSTEPSYLTCPDNKHPHLIDLGLPSGTKWACCNVGATAPEDYGAFYAWGELDEKTRYDWSTYLLCEGTANTSYDLGTSICGTDYDVAHRRWEGKWQMPSLDQFKELLNYTNRRWTMENGKNGYAFSNTNGGRVFLPAAGLRNGTSPNSPGSFGWYWTGTQAGRNLDYAYYFRYEMGEQEISSFSRSLGRSVRPVVCESFTPLRLASSFFELTDGEERTVEITTGNGSYIVQSGNANVCDAEIVGSSVKITAVSAGSTIITVTDARSNETASIGISVTSSSFSAYSSCPDDNHPHLLDLGLPSGTKWACCNVDASSPMQIGGYYAWGEKRTKTDYSWTTYLYGYRDNYSSNGGQIDAIHNNTKYWHAEDIGADISGTIYDVAYSKWGDSWSMPSSEQCRELLETCTRTWATLNGVSGCKFTGSNGVNIFFPSCGYREGYNSYSTGQCYYWSSTSRTDSWASCLYLENGNGTKMDSYTRQRGLNVRPVGHVTLVPLQLSSSTLELIAGGEEKVEITSGNGSYTVESSDLNVATVELVDETVKIMAVGEGSATITITDTISNETVSITITVSADSQ